jgi:diacylglycerol kinase (ATP)
MEKRSTNVCFIVNPNAGKNRSKKYLSWLKREAGKRWYNFEIVLTKRDESVIELAADKAESFDILVACGGDGTVNQVVNGIEGSGKTLAVLPLGTGNDFVRSLGLPDSPEECLELIYFEKTVAVDLIRCEGDVEYICINTLGIGLDGLANYHTKSFKRMKGAIVYVVGAIKAAFQFRGAHFNLKIDGEDYSDQYLMITACNGKWEGGQFYLAPEASLTDGFFDVVTIQKISLVRVFIYLLSFRKGPAAWMSALNTRKSQTLVFECDKAVTVHADGENLGTAITHLNIKIEKAALNVISSY